MVWTVTAFLLSEGDTAIFIESLRYDGCLDGGTGHALGVSADCGGGANLLLVTHEHMDHNGVAKCHTRLTGHDWFNGHLGVPVRQGNGHCLQARSSGRDERVPTRFSSSSSPACVRPISAISARQPYVPSNGRQSARLTCCSCRSAGCPGRWPGSGGHRSVNFTRNGLSPCTIGRRQSAFLSRRTPFWRPCRDGNPPPDRDLL